MFFPLNCSLVPSWKINIFFFWVVLSLYKWTLKTVNQKTHFEFTCKKSVESEKYCITEDKTEGEETKTRARRRSTAVTATGEDFS